MGRSTEQSYKVIADYLKQRKVPATLNDMVDANIMGRATLYRLLRPESFAEAALFGVVARNNTKPYFFDYDPESLMRILEVADPNTAAMVRQHKDVVTTAAKQMAADSVVLDALDKQIHLAATKHRAVYKKDATLETNFKNPPQSLEKYYDILDAVREGLLSDSEEGLTKFRTLMLSFFVSGIINESE